MHLKSKRVKETNEQINDCMIFFFISYTNYCVITFSGCKLSHPFQVVKAQEGIRGMFTSIIAAEQRLVENCRRHGLTFHGHTPADGNCFFHAVSDQLSLLGLPHQSAVQLRNNVVVYLMYHPQIEVSIHVLTRLDLTLYDIKFSISIYFSCNLVSAISKTLCVF